MGDSRELDDNQFAQRMRERRGDPEPELGSEVVFGPIASGTFSSDAGFVAFITLADSHPWYGEEFSECGNLVDYLDFEVGEVGEALLTQPADMKKPLWQVQITATTAARAINLKEYLQEEAEKVLEAIPRLAGTVLSSR